jgi:hypothetical protein
MNRGLKYTLAICGIGILAIVVYFVAFSDEPIRNRGAGAALGEIYVDSPEIYTRERLVNDRFREDAWLKEMLKLLSNEDAVIQGIIRTSVGESSSVSLDGSITASPAEEISDADTASKQRDISEHSSKVQNEQTTLRDRFKRYLDIRGAIRKQIVENQLDDRHDLSANTLYAFKFDVTVLPPGNDTSAWAKVTISISESDRFESEGLGTDSKERLFLRWVRHLEEVTNKAYFERIQQPDNLSEEFKRKLLAFAPTIKGYPSIDRSDSGADIKSDDTKARLAAVTERLTDLTNGVQQLSWLIGQWTIADMITSRDLDKYVVASTEVVDKFASHIVLEPRVASKVLSNEGFEFEELAAPVASEPPDIDGLTEFKKLFIARSQTLFTYSVSPTVSVENVADSGSYLSRQELSSKLLASGEAADVKMAIDLARQSESSIGAIRRNALIVGYADRKRTDEYQAKAVFGWYIGPRFQISEDGRGYYFRHVPNQHALSALIALPAGWPQVKITVKTQWIREDGSQAPARRRNSETSQLGQRPRLDGDDQDDDSIEPDSYSYYIDLPTDLDKVTSALSTGSLRGESLGPIVFESELDKVFLKAGMRGAVLIPGRNLWRSTVVTIGAQSSNSISVLPNMEGIIAHFDKIQPGLGSDSKEPGCSIQPIRIWTSTGVAKLHKDKWAQICD